MTGPAAPRSHSPTTPLHQLVPQVGVVVPYDMALDHELRLFCRDEAGREQLDLLFTRTPYEPLAVTAEQAREISRPQKVIAAAESLRAVSPAAQVYGCTSGSFVRGRAGERQLTAAMAQAAEAPCLTTSGALLEVARGLGLRRIATATPYDDAITAQFAAFFAEAGIHLMSNANLGLDGRIWTVPHETTAALIRRADSPEAEAVLVSCTNLPTHGVLEELEAELGKPVISANQATAWATLNLLGRPYRGPGRALRALSDRRLRGRRRGGAAPRSGSSPRLPAVEGVAA